MRTSTPSSESPLERALASRRRDPADETAWEPERLRLDSAEGRARIAELLSSGAIRLVHDTLERQLAELLETRNPSRDLGEAEIAMLVRAHLGATPPGEYGVWIFYPWSGELVHILPEDEFRELRTSRNRNKITDEEQDRLRELAIGIVGLSVGQSTALTLVLEEVGGSFRLTDYDHLDLSNLNRLRAGVSDLGLKKTVITAREIFEINPFADVSLFSEGLTEENMDAFLLDGGKLDILFDECDDLEVKLSLRERARELGIPVLMETSDRGLIDIERFDREPERPILHGLVGHLKAEDLRGLSTREKVPAAMQILGEKTISTRMAASMIDIGTSLKTWPQLASAVALGGALNTDATRRMALGRLHGSGRFYVDLEDIISDGRNADTSAKASYDVEVSEQAGGLCLPPLVPCDGGVVHSEHVRTLVAYGTAAPSGGNCQPWRFEYRDGTLRCIHDLERSRNFLDFQNSATYLAFGALLENVEQAAAAMGIRCSVVAFPVPADRTVICDVDLEPADTVDEKVGSLAGHIAERCTNRRLGERVPLAADSQEAMDSVASEAGARLQWIKEPAKLDAIGRILGHGDRLRLLSRVMHKEMMREIRWSAEEVERTRDGIDVATLEMTPADLAGMKLISHWSVMSVAGRLGAGAGLERPSRKAIRAASAVGLLTIPGEGPRDFLRGGRVLQRVWLTATGESLALQPMTALVYLFQRLERGDPKDFFAAERKRLRELRQAYLRLFDVGPGEVELMVFRVAHADPPTARALRRPVESVLAIR